MFLGTEIFHVPQAVLNLGDSMLPTLENFKATLAHGLYCCIAREARSHLRISRCVQVLEFSYE